MTNESQNASVGDSPVPDTVLNVTLSDTLKTTLSQDGVTAAVVYFAANGRNWTTLAEGGQVVNEGRVTLPLTSTVGSNFEGLSAGKVYFLIQSQDPDGGTELSSVINSESDINWGSAKQYDYRFDSFEVTLENSPDDKGNLTSVNGFGIPMHLSVPGATVSEVLGATSGELTLTGPSAGYKISGADMFTAIAQETGQTVDTYSSGPLAGEPREAISPSVAVVQNDSAFAPSDWDAYVDHLKTVSGIEVAGFFNGAPDAKVGQNGGIWHNAGFYAYTLEWDAENDVFWLSPTAQSQIKGHIQFTEADLTNSIYSTLGHVGVYETKTGDPYQILDHAVVTDSNGDTATMNTGENNQWGAVLAQFLTGFTAGYYGTEGQSLNPQVTTPINLDQNWNWDPSYAFGNNLSGDQPIFKDAYSEVLFENSNSYGSGYSDALMQQYSVGGPLLSMSDSSGKNVAAIELTLFDDSETPSGYVEPVIFNYTPAGTDGYVVPTALSTNTVGLNLANASVVAASDTAIVLEVLSGTDGNGAPTWHQIDFTPPAGQSLWQNWAITGTSSSNWTATPSGGSSPPGQLLITSFPGTQAGNYWFRMTIGEGDAAKTFNLYTEIGSSGEGFVNPLYVGGADAIAIDGLATIAPPDPNGTQGPTIGTFNINFLYGASTTVAPANLVYNTEFAGSKPNAPVAGTLTGTTFTALPGQDGQVTNSASTSTADVAFSWVGGNDASGTRSWISGYTNKTGALNFAEIQFAGATASPIHTSADLDGQWQTASTHLGNGTYTVTMREFLSTDTALKTPIGQVSDALTLNVNVAEAGLASAGGGALALDAGGVGAPAGNWVKLEVAEAPGRAAGTAVVAYLVDGAGNFADEDTGIAGPDVTLEEAIVATLGGHQLSDGTVTVLGEQYVHLPSDLRLAFATLAPNGTVDLEADVRVRAAADGTAAVSVGGFTIAAETDNWLPPEAVLASAQRAADAPFMYLQSGAHLLVEGAGSSPIANSVGFVRVDLNMATGDWSVGGVAPGEMGFERAVRAALETDSVVRGRGDFTVSEVWTVEGEDGFYAPVLLSAGGDIVVAPADDGSAFRSLGDNTFVFEDKLGDRPRDFDDILVRVTPVDGVDGPALAGGEHAPLFVEGSAGVAAGARFASTFSDDDAFSDTDFGLTLSPGEDGAPARLLIGGLAIFRDDSDGILLEGGPVNVRVQEGGMAIRRSSGLDGDEAIITARTGDAPVQIRNDGVVRGTVELGSGDDTVWGKGEFDGTVSLGGGADRMTYDGAAELADVRLGRGDDAFIAKGAGAVSVNGGEGDDWIVGGSGDDVLFGRQGDDVLRGGAGDDVMAGNEGADRFILDLDNGDDLIRDFEQGSDVIDLRDFGLGRGEGASLLETAVEAVGDNAVRLDLAVLGGDGSALIRGLSQVIEPGDVLF